MGGVGTGSVFWGGGMGVMDRGKREGEKSVNDVAT